MTAPRFSGTTTRLCEPPKNHNISRSFCGDYFCHDCDGTFTTDEVVEMLLSRIYDLEEAAKR